MALIGPVARETRTVTRYSISQPVTQVEAPRLVTGKGRYTDDVNLPRQAAAAFRRSPHAHADIVRIDTSAAEAMPGVLAVLTGDDYAADGLGEATPMAHARRRNDGTGRRREGGIRRVTKAVTKGVTKAVTCAASPIEQLARRRLRFGLELRPPVTERLQRDALHLAIVPLIQVTALPRFMMRPPERLPVSRPGCGIVSNLDLLSFENVKENKSELPRSGQVCIPRTLTLAYPIIPCSAD